MRAKQMVDERGRHEGERTRRRSRVRNPIFIAEAAVVAAARGLGLAADRPGQHNTARSTDCNRTAI